jgi:hypothetical protein
VHLRSEMLLRRIWYSNSPKLIALKTLVRIAVTVSPHNLGSSKSMCVVLLESPKYCSVDTGLGLFFYFSFTKVVFVDAERSWGGLYHPMHQGHQCVPDGQCMENLVKSNGRGVGTVRGKVRFIGRDVTSSARVLQLEALPRSSETCVMTTMAVSLSLHNQSCPRGPTRPKRGPRPSTCPLPRPGSRHHLSTRRA